MGEDLARLAWLLILGAAFVNITRGSFRAWLSAKFVGHPTTAPSFAASSGGAAAAAVAVPGAIDLTSGSTATPVRRRARPAHKDLAPLRAGDPFTTSAILRAAFGQAPRGWIPHKVANEGQVFTDEHGRRFVRVKYVHPIQPSDTRKVYLGG
jgi:hypothetical protein